MDAAARERARIAAVEWKRGLANREGASCDLEKKWVVVVPADHQFDVRDLSKFLDARESADIIGSYRIVYAGTLQGAAQWKLIEVGHLAHFAIGGETNETNESISTL